MTFQTNTSVRTNHRARAAFRRPRPGGRAPPAPSGRRLERSPTPSRATASRMASTRCSARAGARFRAGRRCVRNFGTCPEASGWWIRFEPASPRNPTLGEYFLTSRSVRLSRRTPFTTRAKAACTSRRRITPPPAAASRRPCSRGRSRPRWTSATTQRRRRRSSRSSRRYKKPATIRKRRSRRRRRRSAGTRVSVRTTSSRPLGTTRTTRRRARGATPARSSSPATRGCSPRGRFDRSSRVRRARLNVARSLTPAVDSVPPARLPRRRLNPGG